MGLLSETLDQLRSQIDQWRNNPNPVWGTPSGLPALDLKLGGLQPESLYLIAARPSMGKSSLGFQILFDVSRYFRDNRIDAMSAGFSAEMKKGAVVLREIARQANVEALRIRAGDITDEESERIDRAMREIDSLPIFIDDQYSKPTSEVVYTVADLEDQFGAKVGVVAYDYIQQAEDQGANRKDQVSLAAKTLKQLARSNKIPVIALSQLNRDIEKRQWTKDAGQEEKEPVLSDLKDSGVLEQEADVVIFIHLPGRWKQISEGRENEMCDAKLIVAKNRDGRTGPVWCQFDPLRTAFVEP